MILSRIHLVLLFDTKSQSSSKQIWTVLVGTKYPTFRTFFNFDFKRLKHFVNYFWFWWYVIQQLFTKIFNLLHALSNAIFLYFAYFSSRYLVASKVLVVNLVWDHLKSTHQRCYLFVLLILPLPGRVSTLPF